MWWLSFYFYFISSSYYIFQNKNKYYKYNSQCKWNIYSLIFGLQRLYLLYSTNLCQMISSTYLLLDKYKINNNTKYKYFILNCSMHSLRELNSLRVCMVRVEIGMD